MAGECRPSTSFIVARLETWMPGIKPGMTDACCFPRARQINSCIFVDSDAKNFSVVLRGVVFPSSLLAR
jgi:hypothetical protein